MKKMKVVILTLCAGMVMAACVLAKYHNDSWFVTMLNDARQEYVLKKFISFTIAKYGLEETPDQKK